MKYLSLLTYHFKGVISHLMSSQNNNLTLISNQFTELERIEEIWIIPPYLGEMGFEVLWFLGSIEPWLNSGWKILAKRPELYPINTAIYDEELFLEIHALMKQYKAESIFCRPRILPSRKTLIRKIAFFQSKVTGKRAFEKKLKQLVGDRILHQDRPACMPWDNLLTNIHNPDPCMHSFNGALKPSYLPPDFVKPKFIYESHIGVQLRNYREPSRNSDTDRVMAAAKQLANHLNLKILMYGHPNGTLLVDGYHSTIEESKLRKISLLSTELSCLAQCKVMFAPPSGWCDVMAWLQVPTILEKIFYKNHTKWWKVFKPRIALLKDSESIHITYEKLISNQVCYPLDDNAPIDGLTVAGFNNRFFQ